MYMLLSLITVLSILVLTAFIHQMAYKHDSWEHGYATGAILAMFLMITFRPAREYTKTAIKLFNTRPNAITSISVILAFIGGFLWMMGEYFEWTGRIKHPVLDPVGAMFCFAAAALSLLVHFSK